MTTESKKYPQQDGELIDMIYWYFVSFAALLARDTSNDDYSPPVSTKDTHNTARKIEKEGISIIGVALEEEKGDTSCYETLKEVYDRVIDVDDMKHLTAQLLNLVSKLFL